MARVIHLLRNTWRMRADKGTTEDATFENTETLQTAISNFKRRVKQITKHCVEEEDERYTNVSYARENRLQGLAITNKHTAMIGTPIINDNDAELIVKAILAMRGSTRTSIRHCTKKRC